MESTYNVKSFSGGINQAQDVKLIGIASGYDMANVDIKSGVLKRAKGTQSSGYPTLLTPIKTLIAYYTAAGANILAASGGKLYRLVEGAWVDLGLALSSDTIDYINYQYKDIEALIFTSGVDNVKYYDGTAVRDLKLNGADSAASESNVCPKMRCIELFKERLWGIDDKGAVMFSTPFDPDDWTAPTFPEEEINQHGGEIQIATHDGGHNIGLKIMGDDVYIFRARNVWRIFGSDPENYTMIQSLDRSARIYDRTIKSTNTRAFWFSNRGLYYFDSNDVSPITTIFQEIFNGLNMDKLDVSCAAIWDDKYILALPYGTSNVNNITIEYDYVNGTINKREGINASCFLELEDKLLYSTDDGHIYEYGKGSTQEGQTISSYWVSGKDTFGTAADVKGIFLEEIIGSGDGQVKVSFISEKKARSKIITLTGAEKAYPVNLSHEGKVLQLKIENIAGSYFELMPPNLSVEV